MTLASNITKRGGSARYYARIAVPKDLKPVYQRTELWKSLGTADPREARSRAASVVAMWHADFDKTRSRREPTVTDMQAATWRLYQSELEIDRKDRMALEGRSPSEIERDLFRNGRRRALQKHLSVGETALIEWAIQQEAQHAGLKIDKGTPAHKELAHRLQRAVLESVNRADERDEGNWSGEPKDPIVAPPTAGATKTAAPGESIMELYDRFTRERAAKAAPDTYKRNRQMVQLFAEFVGERSHISAMSRKNVRDFKHALAAWPIKSSDNAAFQGKKFSAIIELNKHVGRPTLTPISINKHLAAISAFAHWLLANDYIDSDIMAGMYLQLDRQKKKRFPFTDEQLKTIFSSPLFTGCASDRREHKPGRVRIRDWRYWVPLILLYTGARLGEICQLLCDDVKQIHGVWVFHITREGGEDKKVKTAGSQRLVPIHSELIRLGLIDEIVVRAKASGRRLLFDGMKPDARGFWSGEASKFLNGYFRTIGVKTDTSVNVHSFRHGMADAFRRAGYLDEQFGMLLGHTAGTTTGRYGIMPQGPLMDRVKMIEAVWFPGLVLI